MDIVQGTVQIGGIGHKLVTREEMEARRIKVGANPLKRETREQYVARTSRRKTKERWRRKQRPTSFLL
jgi:hypothetical protein